MILRRSPRPKSNDPALCSLIVPTAAAAGRPERIGFEDKYAHEDWPGKLPGDLGYAYVSIEGEDFVEAVIVTVADVAGKHVIRHIEWGRP